MPDYVDVGLVVDSGALALAGLDYMTDVIPGWTYRPANLITILLEANGQMAAEILDQASPVAPAVYMQIAETIYGITRQVAIPAVATATITFDPATPVVMIDAGSQIVVPNPSGDPQVFITDSDVLAPVGGGDVVTGVTALEPGAAANGSFGTAELVTAVDGVTTVVVTTAQGGVDEEDDDQYLNRVTNLLELSAPRPILPRDFAILAQEVPGVGRATAIDLLMPPATANPVGDTAAPEYVAAGGTNVPRCTTIAVTGPDGAAPDVALMTRVYQTIDAQREVNFLTFVVAPTYTVVDVTATVVAYPGELPADVQASAVSAVNAWLDPANWGTVPGAGTNRGWAVDTSVRLYEAVQALADALGVFYVQDVTLGPSGGPLAAADMALTGVAPLPQAGVITVTAILPP